MKQLVFLFLSICTLSFVQAQHGDDFEIHLKSGSFTPEVAIDVPNLISGIKEGDYVYRIIQFYKIPNQAEQKFAALCGLDLLEYIPNSAFIARIHCDARLESLGLMNIRSIVDFKREYRLSPELQQHEMERVKDEFLTLSVKYHTPADKDLVQEFIKRAGGNAISCIPETNVWVAEYPASKLDHLAKYDLIHWIEPVSPPSVEDDKDSRSTSRSNTLNTSYDAGRKYDGEGVVVAVSDDGMIGPHIDFEGRATLHTDINSGKHGDMTSGVFVGAGNLNPIIGGMAPGCDIHIYKQGTTVFLSSYQHIVDAVQNMLTLGTVITSTSYSQGQGGVYTTDTEFTDKQLNENKNIMHVFSAGNSGTRDHGYGAGPGWGNISGGIKAGKNVICAGNVSSTDEISRTSSRGPANDGRIKPDLCAQGDGQMSTDENNTYQQGAGTSASAPMIAGVMAQLYQAYRELNQGQDPETGLLKAALLNTAKDLGNPGPDYIHGWGRINGLKAVRIIEEERFIQGDIGHGEQQIQSITVPANVKEVRFMTYWADIEGNPSSSVALVNDLNMQVTAPNAGPFNPWVLDPTPNASNLNAVAVRGIDNLNNVEQVTLTDPEAGEYMISVDGFAIPKGPQSYYVLVDFIYNDIELTYPLGGEGLVPNETEIITWDASDDPENFVLEYSLDGGISYMTISDMIPGFSRSYRWIIPTQFSNKGKIRLTRGFSVSESPSEFTIAGVPRSLRVVKVCPDTIELTWDPVGGVDKYQVYMLGEKYMDSIGTSSTNTFYVVGQNPNDEHWFSVSSVLSNSLGRRAIAIKQTEGTKNCILSRDLELVRVVSPADGVVTNCGDLSNAQITIEVKNLGLLPLSNIDLNYQIDGGKVTTENYNGPILPGEIAEYQFSTTEDLSQIATYNIRTWLFSAVDQNFFNDSLYISTTVVESVMASLPHEQTFNLFSTCTSQWTTCNLNCALSNGYTNLENGNIDDIDWRARSGATPSRGFSSTGTTGDYDMDGNGVYLYLESISGCTFKEGQLLSPCIDLTNVCASLEFAYHMFGSQMGELHVDIVTTDAIYEDVMSPIKGNQGDVWNIATIDLSDFEGQIINILIRGITGNGSTSVIVIDAISVMDQTPFAGFNSDFASERTVDFSNTSVGQINSYLWNFGDGKTSTETSPSHEYDLNGNFDVTLIAFGNCKNDTLVQSIMVGPTSIDNSQLWASKIKIYPNPSRSYINIHIPEVFNHINAQILLRDVIGQALDSKNVDGQRKVMFNTANFESGIYFIEINSESGRCSKKVVIHLE